MCSLSKEKGMSMEKITARKRKKLQKQNTRAFEQKGLLGLASVARKSADLLEMGSSSIIDPEGHIARIKMAMGIVPSTADVLWASCGNTDSSLYIGFLPGHTPSRVHPQVWLRRFVMVMSRVPRESIIFVDSFLHEMETMVAHALKNIVAKSNYPEPELEKRDVHHLFHDTPPTVH
jgi:hypothetical protein